LERHRPGSGVVRQRRPSRLKFKISSVTSDATAGAQAAANRRDLWKTACELAENGEPRYVRGYDEESLRRLGTT
jgi:hypothetical protein